jgi:hypothetical protein
VWTLQPVELTAGGKNNGELTARCNVTSVSQMMQTAPGSTMQWTMAMSCVPLLPIAAGCGTRDIQFAVIKFFITSL